MKLMIPATSANLGCGYDSLGLAVRLYNTFEFWETEQDAVFDSDIDPNDHLVFQALREAQYTLAFPKKTVTLKVDAGIPVRRGLGSSAACVAAGVMMAFLLEGRKVDPKQVLSIGTGIEGHPDNLAPIVYGGLTASAALENGVVARRFPLHADVEPVIVVPRFEFATRDAREALPESVPMEDAVANVSRVGLLLGALEDGLLEDLDALAQDRLHEPYRIPKIAEIDGNYRRVIEKMRTLAHGISLSGAGPSLIAFTDEADVAEKLQAWFTEQQLGYDAYQPGVETVGYRLEG